MFLLTVICVTGFALMTWKAACIKVAVLSVTGESS
jgi:hypothetical protein